MPQLNTITYLTQYKWTLLALFCSFFLLVFFTLTAIKIGRSIEDLGGLASFICFGLVEEALSAWGYFDGRVVVVDRWFF
uniref:ATP synthase F0 subunit 8 n=1 Tax=Corallimorphus profundus TaxID=1499588 RepID=A0A0F7DXC3_9CNID|nr:ATP synthase F0 subunit 8 [Corallimorphus profundus]